MKKEKFIRHLREKIEIDPSEPRYIKMIWGRGYFLENKQERKVRNREQREAESQRMFELKQIKKKKKHRGH